MLMSVSELDCLSSYVNTKPKRRGQFDISTNTPRWFQKGTVFVLPECHADPIPNVDPLPISPPLSLPPAPHTPTPLRPTPVCVKDVGAVVRESLCWAGHTPPDTAPVKTLPPW